MKQKKVTVLHRYRSLFSNERMNSIVFFVALILGAIYITVLPDLAKSGLNTFGCAYIWGRLKILSAVFIATFAVFAFFTILVRRIAISYLILGVFSWVLGVINYFKISYRGEPLLMTDIIYVKDALIVTKNLNYNIFPLAHMWVPLILLLFSVYFLWFVRVPSFLRRGKRKNRILVNLAAILSTMGCIFAAFTFILFREPVMANLGFVRTFLTKDTYYLNAFYPSFIVIGKSMIPSVPKGYSEKAMRTVKQDMLSESSDGRQVDVITIVVESWFELDESIYGASFDANLLENYEELSQEGTSGMVVSPWFSGGTADVEYELLTGFSYVRDQVFAIPFHTISALEYPSIANYYQSCDYSTVALHAYTDLLYNRRSAYGNLGFQQTFFNDSFDDPEMVGPYISDAACFEKLIELYEKETAGSDHVFMHTMTMQNHVPFEADRYAQDELIAFIPNKFSDIPAYNEILPRTATAHAATDRAIGDLIEYFRNCDRDVILIILGDHQTDPKDSERSILNAIGFYDTYNEEKDFLKLHTVPYLVWANFDCARGDTFGNIPPNMLLVNALCSYDIDRPAYFDYLYANTTTMNGETTNYVVNLDGSVSFTKTDAQLEEDHRRTLVQYDLVFGKKYLIDAIY